MSVFIWRLFVLMKQQLLWRVRRKLILSYIFIGVVPSLLIVIFFLLGGAADLHEPQRLSVQGRVRRGIEPGEDRDERGGRGDFAGDRKSRRSRSPARNGMRPLLYRGISFEFIPARGGSAVLGGSHSGRPVGAHGGAHRGPGLGRAERMVWHDRLAGCPKVPVRSSS